ncbi:autotransporter adhesin, partial [Bartonella callosciuri]|nr:autotransporter adhesin [Bartonella callosciuri]
MVANLLEDGGDDRFVIAYEKDAIAIGSHAQAEKSYSVAIGSNALVRVKDGVAIGGGSVSLTQKGILGYDPATNESSTDNSIAWKSTAGAFNIGEVGGEDGRGQLTRQITGVAAGIQDTDAVNVAQLKALKESLDEGWILSVNGKDGTGVSPGSTVDFTAVRHSDSDNTNIKIVKGENNTITFDLNEYIKVNRVETGISSLSNAGLIIKGGPNVTEGGINAGNKKITGVMAGERETDAVNYAQLKEVEKALKGNFLVKQDEEDSVITIGKETGGREISVAGVGNAARTISGVRAGIITADSMEAVNGAQLFEIKENIDSIYDDLGQINRTVSNYFGGGADTSNGTRPIYTIQGNQHTDVGSAFAGVDVVLSDVYEKISKATGTVQDALLWDAKEGAFVAFHGSGEEKSKSKLKYLLDGEIAENSTEAITGHQLYVLSNQLATYFGGGAKYENGQWIDPSFNIKQIGSDGDLSDKSYKNVADAFGGVNSNLSNLNDRLKIVEQRVSPVPPSDADTGLHWDEEQGAYDASHDGEAGKITNVADGKVEQGSSDAVNGGQLWQTNER